MSKSMNEKKEKILQFSGPIAEVVTPFDSNGALNTRQILPYAQHLIRIGVKGIYIAGATSGEGFSLSLEEKFSLIQAWRNALDYLPGGSNLLTIVNVSSIVIGDTSKFASKVSELGFDAIALLPPVYYNVPTKDHLVRYLKQIIESGIHSAEIPVLYSHVPGFTGDLKFEIDSFVELALEKIPQFVGLKFTDANLVQFGQLQSKFGEKLKIFPGFNEILLPTKSLGLDAAICLTFSFADCTAFYQSLVSAVDRSDYAQARADQSAIDDKWDGLVAQRPANVAERTFMTSTIKHELNKDLANCGLNFGKSRPQFVMNKISLW